MISLDVEATGLDVYHGSAKPFLVTTCNEENRVDYWLWEVDPLTREPEILKEDLLEIKEMIENEEKIVFQNAIYDVSVLKYIFEEHEIPLVWDWAKVEDTIYMSHLLGSNYEHNLTSLALRYLGISTEPYEKELEKAVKSARNHCRRKSFRDAHGEAFIASSGHEEMPSIKQAWKADFWLPRAVALLEKYPEDHEWNCVLESYANVDSSVTLALFKVLFQLLEERRLVTIYRERLKLLPVVYRMQKEGIVVNGKRLESLLGDFRDGSEESAMVCTNLAKTYEYELSLPKSGNNKSLTEFCFGPLNLPQIKFSKKTGNPSLDSEVMEEYETTLPVRSKQFRFIKELRGKRKRDTAALYMGGYQRFGIPITGHRGWFLLHPNLNVVGTNTLRWSSSSPNEHNISKKEDFNIRYCFGPGPGREWYSLDANNIELRIPAYESGEPELISLFETPEEPPYYGSTHLLNFSTVYPEIWKKELESSCLEKVGPVCKKKFASSYYQWVKNGGFAIQYGAMDRTDGLGTADKAFHKKGGHALLKFRFSMLETLNQRYIRQAEKTGYVETLPDRNVDPNRGYPLLCTRTKWGGILPTVPLSYHVQGSAMWWMMKAMLRCYEWIENYNSDRKKEDQIFMVAQIHDELVFDLPKGLPNKKKVVNGFKMLMESGGEDFGFPTPVSITYYPENWRDEEEL